MRCEHFCSVRRRALVLNSALLRTRRCDGTSVGAREGYRRLEMDKEIRINAEVSIIIRRHSAAMVEVYRQGVLVWKAVVPQSIQQAYWLRRMTVHEDGKP